MIKIIISLLLALSTSNAIAQVDLVKKIVTGNRDNQRDITATKFHRHTTRLNTFVRYEEFEVPDVKTSEALLSSAKVRRYIDFDTDKETAFLIISIGKDKNTEYIAIDDLLKVRDALASLKQKCIDDSIANRNIKCFFVTDDGFKVGYNIKNGNPTWFFTANGIEYNFKKSYDFSAAITAIEQQLNTNSTSQK